MLKKKEIVLQKSPNSCGAVSIQSVLIHFNGYVPLDKILDDTKTDLNGTNAYNMSCALRKYGFNVNGLKLSLEDITDDMLPLIAHVTSSGCEHFLVVYEKNNGAFTLMDPACGSRKLSKDEFSTIFTGEVLIPKPNGKLLKLEKAKGLNKLLKLIIGEEKRLLFAISIFSIIITVLSLIPSFYIKLNIYNSYLLSLLFILLINKNIFSFIKNRMDIKLYINSSKILNNHLVNHIFNLPLRYIKNKRVGELVEKINDTNSVLSLLLECLAKLPYNILVLLGSMISMLVINKKLFFLFVMLGILYTIESLIFKGKLYRKEIRCVESNQGYSGNLVEYLKALESIKNLSLENKFINLTNDSYDVSIKDIEALNKTTINLESSKSIVYDFIYLLIFLIGLYYVNNGVISLVNLIAYSSLFQISSSALLYILNLCPDISHIKAIALSVSEFLDIKEETISKNNFEFKGLEIKNLSFTYDYYHNVLNNFNLKINKGDKVLIKGASGKGKSTILKLIAGYFDDYTGEILFNGNTLRDASKYKNNIVYIGQEELLFQMSLEDNICLGNKNEEELLKLEKITYVDEIINKKFMGSSTFILEGGTNLSGGERARVILARALYKKPSILLIDETLSTVPTKLEDKILSNLMQIPELTLIYVSHRDKSNLFKKIVNLERSEINEIN